MRFSVFVFLFLSLMAVFGSANTAGNSTGKIITVYWHEGHTGVLIQQVGMSDLGGCGRSDFYILDDGHPYFKEVYSLILSAHMTS